MAAVSSSDVKETARKMYPKLFSSLLVSKVGEPL